ncbi:MAG TPA: helix-turn-helix domain-containing protein [Sphingomonas sp.]|jgi:HTH-type transcriptional regulator/antitoxin HipB
MTQLARSAIQIGNIVKRQRRAAGLTQNDLAERLGVRQATVSSVEAGAGGTKLSTLLDMLAALDLELTVAPRNGGTPTALEDIF